MLSDEEIVRINERLEDHEARISALETLLGRKPEAVKKPQSIREFMLEKKPGNDVQRTLVIGYYLENYESLASFNAKDLERGFRRAKERVPENVNDKVQKNVRKGHMMEAKDKKDNLKAWILTNSGEEHVNNGFKRGV